MPTREKMTAWHDVKKHHVSGHASVHLLLDQSASMHEHAQAMRHCHGKYFQYLASQAPQGTYLGQHLFAGTLSLGELAPVRQARPVVYSADGGSTELYNAVGGVITYGNRMQQDGIGGTRKLCIIFTDGIDTSGEGGPHAWTPGRIAAAWGDDWLPVFLGAFPDALSVGLSMGVAEGNCLTFAAKDLPAAFGLLHDATWRYLTAPNTQAARLLQAGGLFTKGKP